MYATVPIVEPGLVKCSASTVRVSVLSEPDEAAVRRTFASPQIQDLGMAQIGHKDVCRLDIAVNDSLGVRRSQPIGNSIPSASRVSVSSAPPRNVLLERFCRRETP